MFSANQISTFLLGLSVALIPWGLTEVNAIDLQSGALILTVGIMCLFGAVGVHLYPYHERIKFEAQLPFLRLLPLVHFGSPRIIVTSHRFICVPVTLSMRCDAIERVTVRLHFRGPLHSDKVGLQIHPNERPAIINLRWIDRNHESGSIDEVTLEYGRQRDIILLAVEHEVPACIANENFLRWKPNRRKWVLTDLKNSWFQVKVESGIHQAKSEWIPGCALENFLA